MSETRMTKRRVLLEMSLPADCDGDIAVYEPGPEMEEDVPEVCLSYTDFKALGSPEQITVTIEPGDLLNVEPDAWPFKPGDVVLDSGEDSDHAAWLDAAPQRTVVSDCDGDEWTRKNDGLWWMNRGQTARAKSSDLNEQVGPLTVVSVPEATR